MVFDFVVDPLHHNADRAGTICASLSFLSEISLQVFGCELKKVEHKNEKGDEIQQDTRGREQLSRVVLWVVLVLEHGGGMCRHQRHEQGCQFESVEDLETVAVGHHQNLRHDGERNEVRDAGDRQHVVVEVGAEDEEGDGGLSRNDGDLPEPTSVQSVGAIEESHRLKRPAALVREVMDWNPEEDDEEKEQSAVQGTHKGDHQCVDQLQVIALVAFESSVDGPVLVRHVDLRKIILVVHVDAEEHAQCGLQHRHERDIPDDHQRQCTSLLYVTRRSVASVLRQFYRPEHDPDEKYGKGDDAHVDDECQRRRVQGDWTSGAQTHNRASNAFGRETAEEFYDHDSTQSSRIEQIDSGLTCQFCHDDQRNRPSDVERSQQNGHLDVAQRDLPKRKRLGESEAQVGSDLEHFDSLPLGQNLFGRRHCADCICLRHTTSIARRGRYSQRTSVPSSRDPIPSDDDVDELSLPLRSVAPRRALRVPRIVMPVKPTRNRADTAM